MVTTVRRAKDFVALLIKLAWCVYRARAGKRIVFGLWFQRGTKLPILQVEYPEHESYVGKIRKPPSRQGSLPGPARRFLLSALRLAESAGVKFVVWGFCDIESIGISVSSCIKVRRVENGLFAPRVKMSSPIFSYVIDNRSLYFNGREVTDIECILNSASAGEWRSDPRGRSFIEFIKQSNFQKYDDNSDALSVDLTTEDLVVVGQCAGDAAWTQTDTLVENNIDLLCQAQISIPYRKLYYKPHPYNRANILELPIIRDQRDVIVLPPSLSFAQISHQRPLMAVNTSGAGLEAALRGAKIYTFGTSFYSHWGFTEDRTACPRRRNKLSPEDVFFNLIFRYHKLIRRDDRSVIDPLSALSFMYQSDLDKVA
jgi:capsular polysaccharide export protein